MLLMGSLPKVLNEKENINNDTFQCLLLQWFRYHLQQFKLLYGEWDISFLVKIQKSFEFIFNITFCMVCYCLNIRYLSPNAKILRGKIMGLLEL